MGNTRFSDRWIEDGSFARLSQVTLNYTLPQLKAFKSFKVFITGKNLFTYSKYLGYDPEFSYSKSQLFQGVDYGLMPNGKTILAGVKIGL